MTTLLDENQASPDISASLEDYLETIYELSQAVGFARVRDIAKARSVRAASVSIALRRLSELGFVQYERREFIRLTEAGEQKSRRVYARHQLLTRFFAEVLQMDAGEARAQACAMEHSLTDRGMDQFVRFFEFLGNCPDISGKLVERFRTCPLTQDRLTDAAECADAPGCARDCALCQARRTSTPLQSLADVRPGRRARVSQINARGAIRQRMLDMGILPDTIVDVERTGPGGDPVWIKCQGAQLALRQTEASSVLVTLVDG